MQARHPGRVAVTLVFFAWPVACSSPPAEGSATSALTESPADPADASACVVAPSTADESPCDRCVANACCAVMNACTSDTVCEAAYHCQLDCLFDGCGPHHCEDLFPPDAIAKSNAQFACWQSAASTTCRAVCAPG